MTVPDRCATFWRAFARTRSVDPTPRFLEAFHFDDNASDADALVALVLAGRKRATASLLWTYEATRKRVPAPGDLSIVTDFAGTPLCVIETDRVDVVPLDAVDEAFAADEGEGNGSLAFWRRVHDAYFARECQRIGRAPTPDMPVVCERFAIVFPDRPVR
jgi:uncharacterized protein YhfF